jgi:CubicO group peptidase (beta-lactamase class C family)
MAAAVIAGGALAHSSVHGFAQIEPARVPLTPEHVFDVASLTKVMAATSLAAVLVEQGALELDAAVASHLPEFGRGGKEAVTARQLLAHASGLRDPVGRLAFLPPGERPPGRVSIALGRGRELVREAVVSEPLEAAPGARTLYSDVGFLALGWLLEGVGGASLDRLCADRVFGPLALGSTFFIDEIGKGGREGPGRGGRAFVATERCEHRGEVNCGAVNDDNAWAVGGVAAHAGLFSTARDAAVLGQAWLEALRGRASIVSPGTAALFAKRQGPKEGTRALGWDTPSKEGSQLGRRLGRGSRGAIGHLGFTGTSLWIDVDDEVVVALFTNRCHPSRENERIKQFRPRFHDAVAEALGI